MGMEPIGRQRPLEQTLDLMDSTASFDSTACFAPFASLYGLACHELPETVLLKMKLNDRFDFQTAIGAQS
ncbi:hypothetical protein [Paenibacillus kandeliae]|uniref:hypothetical protein n=1 Tax=Paenibacillus kandeliae TaxID=3231269 RepID=UPI00345945D4